MRFFFTLLFTYSGPIWESCLLDCFFHKSKGGIIIKAKPFFNGLLVWVVTLSLLTGCSSQIATTDQNNTAGGQSQTNGDTEQGGETSGTAVKTGLSVVASAAQSTQATQASDGLAQSGITMVAVTVDDAGVIDRCVIDEIRCDIRFDAQGTLVTPSDTQFPSKNELGRNYGMHTASSIDKDWSEQAAAFAAYVEGKTVEEVETMAITEDGKVSDADLAASVTLYVGSFVDGIKNAVGNAQHLGAQKDNTLKLVSSADMASSASATGQEDGTAQADAIIAAVTMEGDTITSCLLDAVQPKVTFDSSAKITGDLTAPTPTKNQLGRDYGMHKASSIDKDWGEQATAFASYVTGKTLEQVAGIAVDEYQKPTQADLTASVTLSIGEFQSLLAKAGT